MSEPSACGCVPVGHEFGFGQRLVPVAQVALGLAHLVREEARAGDAHHLTRDLARCVAHQVRHQRSDAALAELARVQIRDALRRWVPEAELVSVQVQRSDATLELRVRVRESGRSSATGSVEEVSLTLSA